MLRDARRCCLAHDAGGFPALGHGVSLVRPAARGWDLGGHQPPSDARPRVVGAKDQLHRGRDRQPKHTRPPKTSECGAMTLARRSRNASPRPWWIRTVARSSFRPIRRRSRTVTAPSPCGGLRARVGRSRSWLLPTRATKGRASQIPAPSGSRSSTSWTGRSALPSLPVTERWSVSSSGSTTTGVWPKMSRPLSHRPKCSATPPPLFWYSDDWHVDEVSRTAHLGDEITTNVFTKE